MINIRKKKETAGRELPTAFLNELIESVTQIYSTIKVAWFASFIKSSVT
jgi:hypothetical protein